MLNDFQQLTMICLYQHRQILKPNDVLFHHPDLIPLSQPLLYPFIILSDGDMREEVIKGLLYFKHNHVVLRIYDCWDWDFIDSHCFYI